MEKLSMNYDMMQDTLQDLADKLVSIRLHMIIEDNMSQAMEDSVLHDRLQL